jgi:ribosomal protein S27E
VSLETLKFMSRKTPLEKTCPECEEEEPVYDKNKKLICWECNECGLVLSATTKEKP